MVGPTFHRSYSRNLRQQSFSSKLKLSQNRFWEFLVGPTGSEGGAGATVTSRQPSAPPSDRALLTLPHVTLGQNQLLLAAASSFTRVEPSQCFRSSWCADTYGRCGDLVLCRAGRGGVGRGVSHSRWDQPQFRGVGGGVLRPTPSAHTRGVAGGRRGLGIWFCSEHGRSPNPALF